MFVEWSSTKHISLGQTSQFDWLPMIMFYCHCISTLIAMATLNFHRLIMGKMKIGIYCNFIADILTKVFTMFVEWSAIKHILFAQTSLFDWLSWQPKGSICEIYLKQINSSEAIWGMKLKL